MLLSDTDMVPPPWPRIVKLLADPCVNVPVSVKLSGELVPVLALLRTPPSPVDWEKSQSTKEMLGVVVELTFKRLAPVLVKVTESPATGPPAMLGVQAVLVSQLAVPPAQVYTVDRAVGTETAKTSSSRATVVNLLKWEFLFIGGVT